MIFDRRFFAFLGLFTQPFKDFTINPQEGLISDLLLLMMTNSCVQSNLIIESFPLFFKFLEKEILIVKTGACAKVNFLSAQPLFSL